MLLLHQDHNLNKIINLSISHCLWASKFKLKDQGINFILTQNLENQRIKEERQRENEADGKLSGKEKKKKKVSTMVFFFFLNK